MIGNRIVIIKTWRLTPPAIILGGNTEPGLLMNRLSVETLPVKVLNRNATGRADCKTSHHARVSQLAEEFDSKSKCCEFKSHHGYEVFDT